MSTLSLEKTKKDALLLQWEAAATALATAKEIELNLRKSVVEAFYPAEHDDSRAEGTRSLDLGNGFKLKAVFKMNRRIDIGKVNDALECIENVDAEGRFIAERIIRFKPELDKKEYDTCPAKYRRFIDEILTISPATPALEIIEPKAKK